METRTAPLRRIVAAFSLIFCGIGHAQQRTYTFTDLGTLAGPGGLSNGIGISNTGLVTGFTASPTTNHAFVFTPGQGMTLVGDQAFTNGRGINNRGQIALNSIPAGDGLGSRGFVFTPPNQVQPLSLPGGAISTANAINNAGWVTGSATTSVNGQPVEHAYAFIPGRGIFDIDAGSPTVSVGNGINGFGDVTGFKTDITGTERIGFIVKAGGGMTFFTSRTGTDTTPQAINDLGRVAGFYAFEGGTMHAFIYFPVNGFIDITGGRPGDSRAFSINNLGQAVGVFETGNPVVGSAFLYSPATGMVDLNTLIPAMPGLHLNAALAINDLGQITGNATVNGQTHAFLLTPVDVPLYTGPARFVPMAPCRVADTRAQVPAISGGTVRRFPLLGQCNLPIDATAYALNATVIPRGGLGFLTIWPAGRAKPVVSTLNSIDGRIKANAAIVPSSEGGALDVFATDTTELLLDVTGYFLPAVGGNNNSFYPVTPCRVADTRIGTLPLGRPALNGGQTRRFPIAAAPCGIPVTAKAFSLNVTAVPPGPLTFLSAWPTGTPQPVTSTLNAPTGAITANAAVVAAGLNASIDIFSTNTTDLVIDINGYFAPAGGPGGLSFYSLTPCRVADTRLQGGVLTGGVTREFAIRAAGCGVPAGAAAYSLNSTVVPRTGLAFLLLWPLGQALPLVSTLNAFDGAITSNAAIVPAGPNGSINAFATAATDLVLDINGYFAP